MKNNYSDIFCSCGEYIAVKNLKTGKIETDSGVECCQVECEKIDIVKCICPYCDSEIIIDGTLVTSQSK